MTLECERVSSIVNVAVLHVLFERVAVGYTMAACVDVCLVYIRLKLLNSQMLSMG